MNWNYCWSFNYRFFFFFLFLVLFKGVGIDGGNNKDWETNAKSIQLIKQRGKVKALDEEIHSELTWTSSLDKNQSLTNGMLIYHILSVFGLFRTARYWPGCRVWCSHWHCSHPLGHPWWTEPSQQSSTPIWQDKRSVVLKNKDSLCTPNFTYSASAYFCLFIFFLLSADRVQS